MFKNLTIFSALIFTAFGFSSTASAVSCVASFDDIDYLVLDNTDGRLVTRTIRGPALIEVNTIRVRNACEMTLHRIVGDPSLVEFPPSQTRTFPRDTDNIRFVWGGFVERNFNPGTGPVNATTIAGSCTCR